MTTEDDFQAALDANPDDWQTRMVFADWLEDRGDERAQGYRALGARRIYPERVVRDLGKGESETLWGWHNCISPKSKCEHQLGEDWQRLILKGWLQWDTRREAEDAAALAFAQLPEHWRAGMLAGGVPVTTHAEGEHD